VRVWFVVAVALCACSDSSDVTGPFTGDTRRFVVDAIQIPRDSNEANVLAADLDGDGGPENQFGTVTGVLATTNDLSTHASDMIASGALASVVSIQADELGNDDSVGVAFFGADGSPAQFAGGRFVDGGFTSNRTRDTHAPGSAHVRLPIYVNADPLELPVDGMEIELSPDGDGYTGVVRGGIFEDAARQAAFLGLVQMFETEPERHLVFLRGIDKDHDDTVTRAEIDDSVIALLVTADIDLFDGERFAPNPSSTTPDSLSLAFGIHLKPCSAGTCSTAAPVNTCRDRARDGDETDIDCGGSCQACAAQKLCTRAEDCQSRACDAGHCRAASCSDGVRDGYESDIDCGGSCAKCGTGLTCAADSDCANNNCDNGIASLGACGQ
jgi:hypothetical protein